MCAPGAYWVLAEGSVRVRGTGDSTTLGYFEEWGDLAAFDADDKQENREDI